MNDSSKIKNFSGILFLIVGNSGSGKDSIISGIIKENRSKLIKIYNPKRYITRTSSNSENNLSISSKEFDKMTQ